MFWNKSDATAERSPMYNASKFSEGYQFVSISGNGRPHTKYAKNLADFVRKTHDLFNGGIPMIGVLQEDDSIMWYSPSYITRYVPAPRLIKNKARY